jgi:ribosomal peptide maturation radical SAM protein 1
MKAERINPLERIALVSTPWPLYNRPSIQLGALKAYLQQEFPELKVHTLHVYLKVAESIGYKIYREVSERTWLAEMVYAALLFPERKAQIEKIFYREAKGKPQLRGVDFTALASQVSDASNSFIESGDWGHCGLVGFSVSLCQLTSSLYFITRIKDTFPNLPVVVGGSMFAGDAVRGLLETFPQIDAVVNGEGELPTSQLIRHLMNSENLDNMPQIPGVVTRKTRKDGTPPAFHQLVSLSDLPVPDYDDYFHLLKTFSSERTFFPTLPAEISRGCWWRHKDRGCAFCNLNLQWDGYRSKTPKQVVSELDHLTTKYKILSVSFMDNLLPVKESRQIFEQLGQLNKDFRLFGEIRASTPRRVLEAMQVAGTQEVQIGIEALSTRLLKKLNKGTTAIQNLEIMKHCEELRIANVSNLILHFPGSDERDVEETLQNLEFASAFRPLRFVHFWLGLGSPVWQNPKAFGLRAVFNHPNYAAIFPPGIFRSMRNMIQAYRGDLGHQRKLWQPVKKRVRAWKKAYAEIHEGAVGGPILSYRDGRDFLIIRQKRLRAEPLTHRLVGTSRAIYLFCQTHRSLVRILDRFPEVTEEKLLPFLNMMVDKKLMFEESGRYLSLAVSVKPTKL